MDWRLSEGKAEKYSPAEQRLFHLLPKNGKAISSTELVDLFYDGEEMPVHGRTSMNVALKRLTLKVDRNKEPFEVVRNRQQGIKSVEWQIAERRRKKRRRR